MSLDRSFIPALVAAAALFAFAAVVVPPKSAGASPEALAVAGQEARNAAFDQARQRCASYSGDAQASCVIIARARFDRI